MNVAVIGVGQMGLNHVRVYSALDNVNLVAISDINEKLGKKIGKTFNTKYYSNFIKLMLDEKVDAVSVCVPTNLHYEIGKKVLKRGINTLLEKPIASNINQAEILIKLAKENKTHLMIGHIERYNPAIVKLKEMIDKGELGRIIAIIARRVGGFPPRIIDANIAVDLSIHDIDIVNYLLNSLPEEITISKQKNHLNKREDSVEFFLKYGKTSAYLQSNWVTPVKIRKLNVTGSEGYVELDYISQKIDFYKSNYNKFKRKFENYSDYVLEFSETNKESVSVKKQEPLKQEILQFITDIKNKNFSEPTYALEALKIALS